jgi:hypothetical protein
MKHAFLLLMLLTCSYSLAQDAEEKASPKRWATLPIILEVDQSFPDRARNELLGALEDWKDAFFGVEVFKLTEIRQSDKTNEPNRESVKVSWEETDWSFPFISIGVTAPIPQEKNPLLFKQARVVINSYDYAYFQDHNPRKKPLHNLRLIIAHELGHAVGLDHIEETIMATNPMYDVSVGYTIEPEVRIAVACLYADQDMRLLKACSNYRERGQACSR